MARILIVDDEAINRELLHAMLEGAGHQLLDAALGAQAIALAEKERPDLVLLDVMLPDLSGFEVAERLKAQSAEEFLPIVLITALSDQPSRLRGLRAGADDFLSKPIDRHELMLRLGNLLALRAKEAALTQRNLELVELQRFRDELSAMIVHDLKNPLSVMLANVDYVLEGGEPGEAEKLDALRDCKTAGKRALRLLANLLDATRLEAGRLNLRRCRTEVAELLDPLMHQRAHLAESRGVTLHSAIAPESRLYADVELIGRVVENVFDNALRHTPPGGRIEVQAWPQAEQLELRIGNTGPAIPLETRGLIFEKFGQAGAGAGRMNLGLGLYFCRLATEAHGGRIWVEETRELPTVFGLELPS
ncbi:MAG TPA: response regulator [Polyangia bacterium]|jgi:signal transduction histidine kinase